MNRKPIHLKNRRPSSKLRLSFSFEVLESRLCLDAENLPLFLFSANGKLEEQFDFGVGESRILSTESEELAESVDLEFTSQVQNVPTPGTATGELFYSASGSATSDRSFQVTVNGTIDYLGGGSGGPFFKNVELASSEVTIFARIDPALIHKLEGSIDVEITREGNTSHCYTTPGYPWTGTCREADGSGVSISLPFTNEDVSNSSGASSYPINIAPGTNVTTIEVDGVRYSELGTAAVQAAFQWAMSESAGVYHGDFNADADVSVSMTLNGSLPEPTPPAIKSLHAIPAFPKPTIDGSDGHSLSHQPTTQQPLWLAAITTQESGFESQAYFDLDFEAGESQSLSLPIQVDSDSTDENCRLALIEEGLIEDGDAIFCTLVYPASEHYGTGNSFTVTLNSEDTGLATGHHLDQQQSDPLDIFFEKFGDDDGDGIKNWFQYWSEDQDGATSHREHGANDGTLTYLYGGPALSFPGTLYGSYVPSNREIILYDHAALSKTVSYWTFETPDSSPTRSEVVSEGIDAVESTLAHERAHDYLRDTYPIPNDGVPGSCFVGVDAAPDSDCDQVPDFLEIKYERYGFDSYNPDSLAAYGFNTSDGSDEEYFADLASLGLIDEVVNYQPNNSADEANPRRNTQPAFQFISDAEFANFEFVGFTDDQIRDNDEGEKTLVVSGEVEATTAGTYFINARFEDEHGNTYFAESSGELEPGINTVEFEISGHLLKTQRIDGSLQLRGISSVSAENAPPSQVDYTTKSYNYVEFRETDDLSIGQLNDLEGVITPAGIYVDATLTLNVTGEQPRDVTVTAFLYDSDGNAVGYSSQEKTVSSEDDQLSLRFESFSRSFGEEEMGFEVRNIRVQDDQGNELDFVRSLTSSALPDERLFPEFPVLIQSTSLGDFGQNSSSETETSEPEITFSLQAEIRDAGEYSFAAILTGPNGQSIADTYQRLPLVPGDTTIDLAFDASDILDQRIDGPFTVSKILVLDSEGNIASTSGPGATTLQLAWGQFSDDETAPTSVIELPSETQDSREITVTWSGLDDNAGTGIRSFDIFVAEDDGPMVPWLTATSAQESIYVGTFGKSYRFVSVARDHAINQEGQSGKLPVEVQLISPWQNTVEPNDVNAKNGVTALDALQIINLLGRHSGSSAIEVPNGSELSGSIRFPDTSGDGYVSALDALRVINQLNRSAAMASFQGESETSLASMQHRDERHPTEETYSPVDFFAAVPSVTSATKLANVPMKQVKLLDTVTEATSDVAEDKSLDKNLLKEGLEQN
ncbi:hypothetical protein CA51_01690 [Rosistilla oblonga]|uniref:dockerin type I domain-containing protein n=1 Tax=Rosistilla oblonga TaxID=2527990 RepID=UPI00118D24F8|nr:dockerin type I domain-containing protein [Rosistilla oblonga]QDV10323.1 hypothetical protein CA51_01690 [Rosistilla oblonga]